MEYNETWDLNSIPDEVLFREAGRRRRARSSGRLGKVSCSCGTCAVCLQREYRRARRQSGKDLPDALVANVGPIGPTPKPKKSASVKSIETAGFSVRREKQSDDNSAVNHAETSQFSSVFGIGHSTTNWPEFAATLKAHDVQVLIDVRSYPQSRFAPQFNRNALQASLSGIGIEYRHVPALGGKAPLPIAEQVAVLESLSPTFRTKIACLMCSEKKFMECHRHYTLAPLVTDLGFKFFEIQPDGSLVEDIGPAPQLFGR